MDELIKGYCAKLQGRVQGDGNMRTSHGICPYLGLPVIGNDALAQIISLMERSNNPVIGSAP